MREASLNTLCCRSSQLRDNPGNNQIDEKQVALFIYLKMPYGIPHRFHVAYPFYQQFYYTSHPYCTFITAFRPPA